MTTGEVRVRIMRYEPPEKLTPLVFVAMVLMFGFLWVYVGKAGATVFAALMVVVVAQHFRRKR